MLSGSVFGQTATPTVQRTENFNTSDGGFIGFNNSSDLDHCFKYFSNQSRLLCIAAICIFGSFGPCG